jgi:hypothetical protein
MSQAHTPLPTPKHTPSLLVYVLLFCVVFYSCGIFVSLLFVSAWQIKFGAVWIASPRAVLIPWCAFDCNLFSSRSSLVSDVFLVAHYRFDFCTLSIRHFFQFFVFRPAKHRHPSFLDSANRSARLAYLYMICFDGVNVRDTRYVMSTIFQQYYVSNSGSCVILLPWYLRYSFRRAPAADLSWW